jgi:hypothetical protein
VRPAATPSLQSTFRSLFSPWCCVCCSCHSVVLCDGAGAALREFWCRSLALAGSQAADDLDRPGTCSIRDFDVVDTLGHGDNGSVLEVGASGAVLSVGFTGTCAVDMTQ